MTADRGATQTISTQQMADLLRQSIAAQPNNPEGYLKLGLLLAQQGNEEKAEEYLKQALVRDKNLFHAHVQLGMIYFRRYVKQPSNQPALAQAMQHFRRAEQIQPDSPQILEKLGIVLRFNGQNEESIACFTRLVQLVPDNPGVHYRLGVVLSESDRHEDALRHFDETLRLDPNFIGAYASKASKLERMNRLDEARKTVEAGLARVPDESSLLAALAKLESRAGKHDDALVHFQKALEKPENIRAQLESVYTEIAKIHDKRGRYDEAYAMFEKAQRGFADTPQAKAQRPEIIRKNYENCLRWFTKERVAAWGSPQYDDGIEAPFFVVGFPRSGTTLTEQILSSHPRLVGTQEEPVIDNAIIRISEVMNKQITYPDVLDELKEEHILALRKSVRAHLDTLCGSNAVGKRILDKMPLNIGNLGLIQRLFSEARVLVILRDPRDVVLSCFMQSFENNMAMSNFFTLADAARLYVLTMQLYEHYKQVLSLPMLEIKYELLVADVEGTARSMLEFLGMEWSDDVLRYYDADKNRHVTTPSYEGVMRPVYSNSVARWKHYAKQMEPVQETLAPFVQRFGYGST